MRLTPARMQGLALVVVTLAVYYPALFAPLNPLDDRAIVETLINRDLTVAQLFTRATDYYYRPVLWLTYLADYRLWGAEASFMHLGNLLLHTGNTLLLFACARQLPSQSVTGNSPLPFAAALLFAVHPVNTEAVNWIAARSDLLAGFFVFLSASLLFKALFRQRPSLAWLSLAVLLPGCLSKETSLFFFPGALALIFCHERQGGGRDFGWRRRLSIAAPYLLLPLAYFVIRGPALLRHDAGAGLLRKFQEFSPESLTASLGGIGFYAGKLVWPWPLNLTIDHVPPGYVWLGLLVLAGLAFALYHRGDVAGLFLAAFCVGLSALVVILLRPAWTPVAERYLYIPSAFFCLALVLLAGRPIVLAGWSRPMTLLFLLGIVAIGWTTFSRNLLWQDNILLFEDTVRKAPDFPFAKATLASLLAEAGRKEESAAIIRSNTAPEGLRNADFLDLQRAQLLLQERRPDEARELILEKRQAGRQLYYKFQELLLTVDEVLLGEAPLRGPQEIRDEYLALHRELYTVYREPFYLYRLGQVYLRLGDRENARRCFSQAAAEASPGAHYRASAQSLADKLTRP